MHARVWFVVWVCVLLDCAKTLQFDGVLGCGVLMGCNLVMAGLCDGGLSIGSDCWRGVRLGWEAG